MTVEKVKARIKARYPNTRFGIRFRMVGIDPDKAHDLEDRAARALDLLEGWAKTAERAQDSTGPNEVMQRRIEQRINAELPEFHARFTLQWPTAYYQITRDNGADLEKRLLEAARILDGWNR